MRNVRLIDRPFSICRMETRLFLRDGHGLLNRERFGKLHRLVLLGVILLCVWGFGFSIDLTDEESIISYELGSLTPQDPTGESGLVALFQGDEFGFWVMDERADVFELHIFDIQGELIYSSGLSRQQILTWNILDLGENQGISDEYIATVYAWDLAGQLTGSASVLIDLSPVGSEIPLLVPLGYDIDGNFTVSGYLGIGTEAPQRAVHIRGSNAVFRMDRPTDSAAFLLVRTDASYNPLKTFVVGVNASGANNGEFVINDLGQSVSGSGTRRLTIDNSGNAVFTKEVRATQFVTTSSARLKDNIQTLQNAVEILMHLRGVSFNWKDGGESSLGFIAEEVAQVLPQIVSYENGSREVAGLDYNAIVALLVEATKTQQVEIEQLKSDCERIRNAVAEELSSRHHQE